MGDKTSIEWTDATWNPIRGCSRVSEGCRNCYAERVAARFSGHGMPYEGLAVLRNHKPQWTGEVRLIGEHLEDPLRWTRPRRVFVNSMSELFHERLELGAIAEVWAVMLLAGHHTFQILTKRADRLHSVLAGAERAEFALLVDEAVEAWGLDHGLSRSPNYQLAAPHMWGGVSVENQEAAHERIPVLLTVPAVVRWVSAEPLRGPLDLSPWILALDWVVAGGESGPGARPMHPDWARALRRQCQRSATRFLFKQWGDWAVAQDRDRDDPDWRDQDRAKSGQVVLNLAGGSGFHGERVHWMQRVGKKAAGRELDGRTWDEFPV
jgi:protein gp37